MWREVVGGEVVRSECAPYRGRFPVIPAEAGIQVDGTEWVPAFAGMTGGGDGGVEPTLRGGRKGVGVGPDYRANRLYFTRFGSSASGPSLRTLSSS